MADRLPADAFFCRRGRRVAEAGRYHLDLRHPAARAHPDGTVDRLVEDLGVGYFKFDYNINPGPGTDVGGTSAGEGMLGHNRAHLDWLEALLDRHPYVIIENCASGPMRSDFGMLSSRCSRAERARPGQSRERSHGGGAHHELLILKLPAGPWRVSPDGPQQASVFQIGP
jgi:hypothetical protein